ncbi:MULTISPECIES: RND family transporter [Myxococcus]|uniref:MMPL family transporter n=1 Tax=Myxococcus llanfairpwllgwyngyllgogerychwyrndrobwllllantysiliogogogochensis TaxID=2590453 RepID=A0A540WQ52_9BACT|nr:MULTISPECIES: MMPL family transporter [Myxococcus]NTX03244.1 MMPL family transporter [Myxococcus sp. CA040A]TQF11126.1 MMPL family transporter [Myxococcus llanfairpwllgwyngyllgogerychwyrndrobwllllantysiliogogogochensis]
MSGAPRNPNSHSRFAYAFAELLVRRPGTILAVLLTLLAVSTWATLKLRINSNQLDLISQDLPEVKDVKQVIDMVGGSGFLMLALRSTDEAAMKRTADDIAGMLEADKQNVRTVSYKLPVEFIQQNMVLFVKTEDLVEGKRRIMAFLEDKLRRSNPFYIDMGATKPVELDMQDLVDKYSSVGKKSIRDDYNISSDKKMVLILVKPMWDTTEIGKTKDYLDKLNKDLAAYSTQAGKVKLVEDYKLMGDSNLIAYGYTGSYKTTVDDSFAIEESLQPVTVIALVTIFAITILFFRKLAPTFIVVSGTVIGTIYTLGFTYATIGELNMITSILGGILMGFGIDYGIHFTFRTRLELGAGKPYDVAIIDAFVNAGRPAAVAAIVTGGSFFVLMVSEFRGFSQFGFLAGCGTLILGLTLFVWSASLLALVGRINPEWPKKLIGEMKPPPVNSSSGQELRIPRPGLVLGVSTAIVALICAAAVPWAGTGEPPEGALSFFDRVKHGVGFNYNTRALIPDGMSSVLLQDEINVRFNISSDPMAVYTKDLDEAEGVYRELTQNAHKYPSIDQVVSIFTFVPPEATAKANEKVLQEWKQDMANLEARGFSISALPPDMQDKATFFMKVLDAKPFDVHGVPDNYKAQFKNLPTAQNKGYLTFIYSSVDLFDGQKMMQFADETRGIPVTYNPGRFDKDDFDPPGPTAQKEFRAAGATQLYAKLARIVLWDGKVTVVLTALWILAMHFLDFRNAKLALASVIPLGVGVAMMLGIMSLTGLRLNFMNIIILPILLGFGVSHGLYLLHRFLEGTSPLVALRSVGAAVASSTLTAVAGFAALLAAKHNGLRSMGMVACIGLITTLVVSFTVLAAVMQLMHDRRRRESAPGGDAPQAGGGEDSSTRAA